MNPFSIYWRLFSKLLTIYIWERRYLSITSIIPDHPFVMYMLISKLGYIISQSWYIYNKNNALKYLNDIFAEGIELGL